MDELDYMVLSLIKSINIGNKFIFDIDCYLDICSQFSLCYRPDASKISLIIPSSFFKSNPLTFAEIIKIKSDEFKGEIFMYINPEKFFNLF